jgi:hypothetical protein
VKELLTQDIDVRSQKVTIPISSEITAKYGGFVTLLDLANEDIKIE